MLHNVDQAAQELAKKENRDLLVNLLDSINSIYDRDDAQLREISSEVTLACCKDAEFLMHSDSRRMAEAVNYLYTYEAIQRCWLEIKAEIT